MCALDAEADAKHAVLQRSSSDHDAVAERLIRYEMSAFVLGWEAEWGGKCVRSDQERLPAIAEHVVAAVF